MRITVYGIVQGVGFRPTVYRVAKAMGLRGYVLNNGSNVEIHMDGDPDEFMRRLREGLPSLARIDRVEVDELDEELGEFEIVNSQNGKRVSLIPTDTAICGRCSEDFARPGDKRHMFPFTNCTECGARFTVIADLPFDRARTSMAEFPPCPSCTEEYATPEDRRFHAQTLSCPECGPRYTLFDADQKVMEGDAFENFAAMVDGGLVGLIKGWGGMHIVSTFPNAGRLRDLYRRGDKPYAVMMRDLQTAGRYANIDERERELLTSPQRPIVLLRKQETAEESLAGVSPGLGNVGVMLPYSAAHLLMFNHLKADGVIMTSANLPGEPMTTENGRAFELGLDCYLLHDRSIIHRCDDSVVKVVSGRTNFTRRSRGFVPIPLEVRHRRTVIGVGAQWDVVGSVSRNGEVFLTQYVGETQQYPTLQYLEEAIDHLGRLLGTQSVDAVAMDKHPRYSTRIAAKRLAERWGCDLFETQHYHSHAAALMVDRDVDGPIVCLTWDGTGYGDDGTSWGGETLIADLGGYRRLDTLEGIPLLGGDRAVMDPTRVVTAIELSLGRTPTMADESSVEVYSKMLPRSVRASSMGRVLDAVSCILGVCCRRTYEGEPAIKLERLLELGEPRFEFEVGFGTSDGVSFARTMPMFDRLLDMDLDTDSRRADAAASFVRSLVRSLTERACSHAETEGLSMVGLTGGVTYSAPVSNWVEEVVEERGLAFLAHERVPNGDGGISTGQNAIVGSRLG